jgi:hypothetical protein
MKEGMIKSGHERGHDQIGLSEHDRGHNQIGT